MTGAAQYDDDALYEEIERRLRAEPGERGDFSRVHICPASSAEVSDDDPAVRLVILKPQFTHALRDQQSKARAAAREMLDMRGNTRRAYRNTLVFLAADRARLEDLKQGVRQFLAWESIRKDAAREDLNLDTFQRNQVNTKYSEADKSVRARIPETFTWLLVPDQPKPLQPDDLQELKLQPHEALATNASRRLKTEDMLTTVYAGTNLRRKMDEIPLWRGDHVSLKELADFFARYIYLPRLKNSDVLLEAIREGVSSLHWQQETFAYADSWDTERQRYIGLKTGQHVSVALNNHAVLVKPEAALRQLAADAVPVATAAPTPPPVQPQGTTMPYVDMHANYSPAVGEPSIYTMPRPPASPVPAVSHTTTSAYHRFHGSVSINPRLMAGDAGKIMDEVIKHLTTILGANVRVTLEIQADIPHGVPDETVRTVTENCRTLKFEDFGFEEE